MVYAVTLFTRVWIEILTPVSTKSGIISHSLYESVNWNRSLRNYYIAPFGHSLYESVNWNLAAEAVLSEEDSHSLYESVNWNS